MLPSSGPRSCSHGLPRRSRFTAFFSSAAVFLCFVSQPSLLLTAQKTLKSLPSHVSTHSSSTNGSPVGAPPREFRFSRASPSRAAPIAFRVCFHETRRTRWIGSPSPALLCRSFATAAPLRASSPSSSSMGTSLSIAASRNTSVSPSFESNNHPAPGSLSRALSTSSVPDASVGKTSLPGSTTWTAFPSRVPPHHRRLSPEVLTEETRKHVTGTRLYAMAPLPSTRHTRVQAQVQEPEPGGGEVWSDPYEETLKRLMPRRHSARDGLQTPAMASSAVDSSRREPGKDHKGVQSTSPKSLDPSLVVHLHSKTKQIRLNKLQKEILWEARRREYQSCLVRTVRCLQSHLTPLEKCLRLLALHTEEVIPRRLRLRADTYDDIFHLFFATATLSSSSSAHQHYSEGRLGHTQMTTGEVAAEKALVDAGEEAAHLQHSLPVELASRRAATLALTSEETLHKIWEMYRYMVDSGTNPTPRVLQHVMGLLEQRARALGLGETKKDWRHTSSTATGLRVVSHTPSSCVGQGLPGFAVLEAKAHSLMMDVDRFRLIPTQYTLHSYIFLCQLGGVMHLALARVTDYYARLGHQISGDTYAMLLHGFLHQPAPPPGKSDRRAADALSALTTIQSVSMHTPLLNEMLQVARYASDPLAAFTMYKSALCRMTRDGHAKPSAAASAGRLLPDLSTFSILVECVLRAQALQAEARPPLDSIRSRTGATAPHVSDELIPGLIVFLVKEMKRYGVVGNRVLLNKLLACWHQSGRRKEFQQLRTAMQRKGILVFEEFRRL